MRRKNCKGCIDVYVDGVIYDRAANVDSVISILNEKDMLNELVDIRISINYSDIDIITSKGLKENMIKWCSAVFSIKRKTFTDISNKEGGNAHLGHAMSAYVRNFIREVQAKYSCFADFIYADTDGIHMK